MRRRGGVSQDRRDLLVVPIQAALCKRLCSSILVVEGAELRVQPKRSTGRSSHTPLISLTEAVSAASAVPIRNLTFCSCQARRDQSAKGGGHCDASEREIRPDRECAK